MWHKPCRTFHPWCPCIKTRCLSPLLSIKYNDKLMEGRGDTHPQAIINLVSAHPFIPYETHNSVIVQYRTRPTDFTGYNRLWYIITHFYGLLNNVTVIKCFLLHNPVSCDQYAIAIPRWNHLYNQETFRFYLWDLEVQSTSKALKVKAI